MKSRFIVHKAWFPVYLHVPTYEINLFSRIFLHRGWLEQHGSCYNTNTRPFKHSVFVWYSCENKCKLIGGNASNNLKKTKKNKLTTSLLEKCPYSELFWSSFSSIRTRITPNKDTFYAVLFVRLFFYSHKNNIKMFWYYSHNILIRLLRWEKDRRKICYIWRQRIKNEWTNKIW